VLGNIQPCSACTYQKKSCNDKKSEALEKRNARRCIHIHSKTTLNMFGEFIYFAKLAVPPEPNGPSPLDFMAKHIMMPESSVKNQAMKARAQQ